MRITSVLLAAMASFVLIAPAVACDTPTAEPGKSPLHTRKPVIGEDVRLTSGFGMQRHPLLDVPRLHTGVDWAAPTGTQVVAAGPGRVVEAGPRGEYGNAVLIDHGSGWQTLYGQLLRIEVKAGDCVAFGAPIGKVGSTGLSSGPHLHYEVRRDDKPIDPMTVMTKAEPAGPPAGK
jgi:murein DD-endopeptidase MepM/ murein hydrolase activator NlpD